MTYDGTGRSAAPSRASVLKELDANSSTLLIAFTGKGHRSGLQFNFKRSTRPLKVKRLYVRDNHNLWYHGKHAGIGAGVPALAAHLRGVIRRERVSRVMTLGASMGGYAAILFGVKINADRILAISPQTFVDKWSRVRYADTRSIRLKNRIYACPSARAEFFNLGSVLRGVSYRGRIDVHRGWDRLDRHHAAQIAHFPSVDVTVHETHRHDLGRVLKRKGILPMLLRSAVSAEEDEPPPYSASGPYSIVRSRVKGWLAT